MFAPTVCAIRAASIVIAPAVATTSIVPLPAVTMSATPVPELDCTTLRPARTVMLPVPEMTLALTVTSLVAPPAWMRILPLPFAFTARPSAFTPSVRVMEPLTVRSTIEPLEVEMTSEEADQAV